MSAPARPPVYADAIAGDDNVAPDRAIPGLIDSIVSAAKGFPDWVVEDLGVAVHLHVSGPSSIEYEAKGARGVIELSAEETGWLVAVARTGAAEMFRGYIERPYEDYEIWSPQAGAAAGEAPGRIGKRATWISFAAASWPALAPLANDEGGVNIAIDEAKLRVTMRKP
jgi:hypothetical protein